MAEKKNWVYQPREINAKTGICYGMMDLMGGGWNNIVSGVIFAYLTLAQGFDPAIAGTIAAAGRIVDCIWNMVFGPITDNFYKTKLGQRFGRRHFFMFVGLILFACVFPLFWFNVKDASGAPSFTYYLAVYVGMEVIIAMLIIPWETLPAEMTRDYTKRTTLSGSRMIISATGTALVFLILALLKSLPEAVQVNAYLYAGIAWTVLFIVAIFISWRFTWERPVTPEMIAEMEAEPKLTVAESLKKTFNDYKQTFENKAFRTHLVVYLCSFTGKDFYSTLLVNFVVLCIAGVAENVPWILQAMALLGIPATVAATKLMVTHGPRFLFSCSYGSIIVAIIGYLAIWMLGISDPATVVVLLVVVSILYQVGRAMLEFTPWNLFPFMADVDYIMSREDRAGIYASVMSFLRKSTGALATWIAGIILSAIGYNSATMKHFGDMAAFPQVQTGIALTFFLGTVVLIVLAFIESRKVYLNKQTHAVLEAEIARLEAGGSKADVTPEARKVCEELTGRAYEELWPAK